MAALYGPHWRAARAHALAYLLLGLHCIPAFADSWVIEGRVVALSDGDTITVLDSAKVQHKVRIAGIDAPEKSQAFGTASRKTSRGLSSTATSRRAATSATATAVKLVYRDEEENAKVA